MPVDFVCTLTSIHLSRKKCQWGFKCLTGIPEITNLEYLRLDPATNKVAVVAIVSLSYNKTTSYLTFHLILETTIVFVDPRIR